MQGMPDGFAATITGVREISVTGTADLAYWRKRLEPEGLYPLASDGRAELMIMLTDASWMGWPFRELAFTVVLSDRPHGTAQNGVFLFYAAHSSRALAWMERTFFRTPYFPAQIDPDRESLRSFQLADGGRLLIGAVLSPAAPRLAGDPGLWDCALFLPGGREFFRARLSGAYSTYAFETGQPGQNRPGQSRFDLSGIRPDDAVYPLIESGFVPRRWSLRHGAVHARSKTVPRP